MILLYFSCFISYENVVNEFLNFYVIAVTLNSLFISYLCYGKVSNSNNLTSSLMLGCACLAFSPWMDKKLTKLTLFSPSMNSAPSSTSSIEMGYGARILNLKYLIGRFLFNCFYSESLSLRIFMFKP